MFHTKEFLKHLEEGRYRAYTLASYRKLLERFAAFCLRHGLLDITAIDRKQALEYLQSLGPKDRMTEARLKQLSRLRTYFRFLEEKGLLFESPLKGYAPPEVAEAHYPILTQ